MTIERVDPDKHIYDKLREMLGGRLPDAQFQAARRIILSGYREDFRISLGLNPGQSDDQSTSQKGRKFIQGFESCKLKAYPDVKGVPTIGWGSTRYINGNPVKLGDVITQAQADAMFDHDIKRFENCVNEIITATLSQNQFDALVSLVYNIGETQFKEGSVDDKINRGDWNAAFATWLLYVNSGPHKNVPGLVRRRKEEVAIAKQP